MDTYRYLRPLLMSLEPEKAHGTVLSLLKMGLAPSYKNTNAALKISVWGRTFQNPLGIAAGFDKDAEVIEPLFRMGFGFVEAGTVTPQPQPGNERPRIFRDVASESLINRMGFPSGGMEAFARHVSGFRKQNADTAGILGINIGPNKGMETPIEDYRRCMQTLAPLADYITINVSSPNTAGLRDLQGREDLDNLLTELMPARKRPIVLKISPDLEPVQRADLAEIAMKHHIDGLIVSNTTTRRPLALQEKFSAEPGGLSGKMLKGFSTEVIRDFYRLTEGTVPIIGVGGIATAADAYEKIRAGASLLQLYTALVYQGPAVIARILDGLAALLKQDGFERVADAVGSENEAGKEKSKAVV